MKLDARRRRWLRLQNAAFTLLLLAVVALAAWLSQRHAHVADWTASGRNTLAPASAEAVGLLERPLQATAYVGPDPVQRARLRDLIERYRRAGAEIRLQFINPETNPGIARKLGIRSGGELILRYDDRDQRLQQVSEQSVTNALLRLARDGTRWIVFIEGHGERDPLGDGNFDLEAFGQRLAERGMELQSLKLAASLRIPDNTDVLVIASPRHDYLPGEVAMIRQYVRRGGNLLWLMEPGADAPASGRLQALAADLGVRRRPGVVVDPAASLVGADTPDFAVVTRYGDHAVSGGLEAASLFPQAAALAFAETHGWSQSPLVHTREDSWAETGPIRGTLRLDAADGDAAGPLTLGVAATRGGRTASADASAAATAGQRVAVIGDGDFLSNAYLGNGANLDLGMRLLNWLAGDDAQVRIAPARPSDIGVELSQATLAVVGLGFLLGLPLALLAAGAAIGFRRRRR